MKINITKKEYRLLLEMLCLSDWVMNAHSVESHHPEHDALRKKIMSNYSEMGAEDLIEQHINEYYEKGEFEEYLHERYILPYDEQTFWDTLIDRLALRDAVGEIGIEKYAELDHMERLNKLDGYLDRYANEFEQHGLDYVKIERSHTAKN